MPDALAFSAIYEEFGPRVYRFCLSRLRDPSVAEDVAADVFVSAFAAYDRAQPDPDGLLVWLFRIARNAIIDHHRRQARWGRVMSRLRIGGDPSSTVEAHVEVRSDLRDAFAALDLLSKRDRELVTLRVAGGLSYGEIARVMNMSENAATVATFRAIERIRRKAGVKP